jgi:hypothetical protein
MTKEGPNKKYSIPEYVQQESIEATSFLKLLKGAGNKKMQMV